ncbi:MAG: UDP-N-acetylmuramoyl-tripeptide--D-alanyl-D-alanine ligase [Panacagrimonas sp.]
MTEDVMQMATLSWFTRVTGGLLVAPAERRIWHVTTDSRAVRRGYLFVALRGEHFDGHDFAADAAARGAEGIVTERWLDLKIGQIRVRDNLRALQDMARAWRTEPNRRERFDAPVVAVTGSNGKTTTKQLLAAVFAQRGPVLATRGNLNNHIGLPLTLLELRSHHRTAVIEMGANHPGEIALLTGIAQPDVGVITQAGDAHLEGFGSREGVARAKGELFAGLSDKGIAVINADDAFAPLWRDLARGPQISFGIDHPADVQATSIRLDAASSRFRLSIPGSAADVNLPLPGRHNVMNALAAAASAAALGLDAGSIAAGLARVEAAQGRVAWKTTTQGARLIDDSYNANPTSMRAGLELLAQQPGPRWAVLGGMAELGATGPGLHEDCGRLARELGIERLLLVGPAGEHYARGFGAGAERFDEVSVLIDMLQAQARDGVTLLVKGSRSAGMERVVNALCPASLTKGASH